MPQEAQVEKTVHIPLALMKTETGTWTYSSNSGALKLAKSATAETTTVSFEIAPPYQDLQFGRRLKSVVVIYAAKTADLSGGITAAVNQYNFQKATSAAGAAIDTTALTVTNDGVVTNAANPRKLTISVTSPAFDNLTGAPNPYGYNVVLGFPCAATTVLEVYGAYAIFETVE